MLAQEKTMLEMVERSTRSKTPNISPFKGATLMVLRFLFINGSGYPAQIARHCQITSARACQVLKDLEGKDIVASSSKVQDCGYCAGTGRKNYGTQAAGCIYCHGKGKLAEKTYPIVFRISEGAKPALLNVFNAIYEIGLHQNKEPGESTVAAPANPPQQVL